MDGKAVTIQLTTRDVNALEVTGHDLEKHVREWLDDTIEFAKQLQLKDMNAALSAAFNSGMTKEEAIASLSKAEG